MKSPASLLADALRRAGLTPTVGAEAAAILEHRAHKRSRSRHHGRWARALRRRRAKNRVARASRARNRRTA